MCKVLFVCNTPYQVFVATWIKFVFHKNDSADIIISNHMNNGDIIVENTRKTSCFDKVYYVKTRDFRRQPLTRKVQYKCMISGFTLLDKFVKLERTYEKIYISNVDRFAQLLYFSYANAFFSMKNRKKPELYIYEDGVSTYSSIFESYYKSTKLGKYKLSFCYKPDTIYGHVKSFMAFDPECFMWHPDADILRIPRIVGDIDEFKKVINTIFSYDKMQDVYDKKYIYMEECYFAEGLEINDVELLESLSNMVGKDNIMVKIHPRNPVNRFKALGYKTNVNTFIPWEVIVLNENFSDKVLISIGSTSIVNPVRLFGIEAWSYSLYKCVNNPPTLLSEMWDAIEVLYKTFYPIIQFCEKNIVKSIVEQNDC